LPFKEDEYEQEHEQDTLECRSGRVLGNSKLEAVKGGFAELAMPFKILPVMKLRINLLEQPDYLLAGAAYRVVFACANDGNVFRFASL
jgi:hypothetical protein